MFTYKVGTRCVHIVDDDVNLQLQRHLLMNCKLKSIRLQCLFWKMCKAYSPEDFIMAINELRTKRPDVYQKLTEAGVEKCRVYHVDDRRRIHVVELYSGTCTCQKWQVSGLPCGHVLAVCRVMRLIDFNHLAKGWFRRKALKDAPLNELSDLATAKITKKRQKSVNWIVGAIDRYVPRVGISLGRSFKLQRPDYLQVVKPPLMDKKPAGRPKSTARIRSQGEELVPVRCGRCGYSQQEHYYSEQEHYYSQQAMPFSFKVFIPINEPKRHWSLAQFYIQSGNVTFYESQKTYDPEFRPWYVKMRSCLESKLPVLLQQTGVFASKGINSTSYSIKFTNAQNVPKQGGVFGDCGMFVCLFLYELVTFEAFNYSLILELS
nr:phospholipase-like protein [Tanacetum cinerariifolium]